MGLYANDGALRVSGTIDAELDTTDLESLQTTANTTLSSIHEAVDGLEALITTLNGKLDTLAGYLDAVETKLDGIDTSVDLVVTEISDGVATPLPAGTAMIGHFGGSDYETVAASQTDQLMGAAGVTGDYLSHLLVIPATTSPGAISIEDGATNIPVFTGGASSVSNLIPFVIPIGAKSVAGGWEITTGANVAVIAFGDFT
jgi:hypothetical protein